MPILTKQTLGLVHSMKCFLGLLLYTANFKSNNEDICSIFCTDGTCWDIFQTIMSRVRFAITLTCLRFDNPNDREVAYVQLLAQQLLCQTLKMVILWMQMLKLMKYFSLQRPVQVQNVYAIQTCKIWPKSSNSGRLQNILCLHLHLYCGKGTEGLTLTPEEQNNQNITCNNWCTSIELADELRKRGLTWVGTIKKNRKEIPNEFLQSSKRNHWIKFVWFHQQYNTNLPCAKKQKTVLLNSTMHHSAEYCSSRRTRRWPMVLLFCLLDMSALNAFIVYQSLQDSKPITRITFMKVLSQQLTQPALQEMLMNTRVPKELRMSIA
ncbi:hypothetical protein PR048_000942 [Dryococelus australis]|uniref:PiggyBac transposable element-derived protein domain-containing protein n=1 Tax=Dryococelus australis TaxID=614101 RepID=A0ABQ9IG44_9NEOP|nr:hypothetical protein PR048_000942 [Dryococelus australis]